VLLVGGTHPAPLEALLRAEGFEVSWWCGQKRDQMRRPIPQDIAMVVVVADAINHPMSNSVRDRCRSMGVPLVYARSRKSDFLARVRAGWMGFGRTG
jgi:hypothetical protein